MFMGGDNGFTTIEAADIDSDGRIAIGGHSNSLDYLGTNADYYPFVTLL